MQNETTFLILDGMMILISVITLTITHPAILFPYMGSKKGSKQEKPSRLTSSDEDIEMITR